MNVRSNLLLFVLTLSTIFVLLALINEVNGKSDVAEDGVCKDKFIETVNATDRVRIYKTLILYLN